MVIVVLDCARADDFGTGTVGGRPLPTVAALRKECEEYPRAAAVAPWTVPSHASLFTGLYPWEHHCHAKAALKLSPEYPRLARTLASAGYRTLSLSANHLIAPELGLTDGFDLAAWAGWWEPYVRIGGKRQPPHVEPTSGESDLSAPFIRRAGVGWGAVKRLSHFAYRYPFILDGVGRFTTALRAVRPRDPIAVSSWIEPTLDRWIRATPADRPVFAFVNLLETHEPYYPDPELAPGVARWWRYSRYRQDHVGWLAGRWTPTRTEFDHLRMMYRRTFAASDRRLNGIVETLRANDRWENTLFVLTSDHGQAFGESGMLFHMLRLPEALVRIPLLVRRPGGTNAGARATGWASLVDVVPTVLSAVGRPGAMGSSGRPLESLLDGPRPGPVLSAADGLVWKTIVPEHEAANFSDRRRAEFDRILACAYDDRFKVVYDASSGELRAYDIESDPGEAKDRWPELGPKLASLGEESRLAAAGMAAGGPETTPPDVEDRLRSWGYI